MKKTNSKNQNKTDGRKKVVLKFRDLEEKNDGYDNSFKRHKNEGKRKHRQQTIKDLFYENACKNSMIF